MLTINSINNYIVCADKSSAYDSFPWRKFFLDAQNIAKHIFAILTIKLHFSRNVHLFKPNLNLPELNFDKFYLVLHTS